MFKAAGATKAMLQNNQPIETEMKGLVILTVCYILLFHTFIAYLC